MSDQDKILQFLRLTGPTIPSKVAKHLNTEILLASAHLSDLKAQGKIRTSYLKVGGTPLYFLPGQEHQLFQFAAGNLNPKDLGVLEQLKEKQVLREFGSDLLYKVALRSLQDFAVPLQVTIHGKTELFWKWHLASEEEANGRIRSLLELQEIDASQEPAALEQKPAQEERNTAPVQEKEEAPREEQQRLTEIQKPLLQERKEITARKKRSQVAEEFLPEVEKYLSRLKIMIEQKETVRKNAELNFIVRVPSAVGKTTYFCKAKQKGKSDEKDVSSAYLEAQMKRLPLLFLYTQEINKKVQEMLDSGALENVVVRKIE